MAITSYDSMLPWLIIDIPSVNDNVAKQALREAGRKFCLDTELYEKELSLINVVSGTRTYSLTSLLPANTSIIRIKEVRYGSDASDDNKELYSELNYALTSESTFKFKHTPTASITNGLAIVVILRPNLNATSLETWFYDRYSEALLAFAKYYLCRMDKNKPWSDANRAEMYYREYIAYVERYRIEKYKQYKSADIHVVHVPGRF